MYIAIRKLKKGVEKGEKWTEFDATEQIAS